MGPFSEWSDLIRHSFTTQSYARSYSKFLAAKREKQEVILNALCVLVEDNFDLDSATSELSSAGYPVASFMTPTDGVAMRFIDVAKAIINSDQFKALPKDDDYGIDPESLDDFMNEVVILHPLDQSCSLGTVVDMLNYQRSLLNQFIALESCCDSIALQCDSIERVMSPADFRNAVELRAPGVDSSNTPDLEHISAIATDQVATPEDKLSSLCSYICSSIPSAIEQMLGNDDYEDSFTLKVPIIETEDYAGFKGMQQLISEVDGVGNKIVAYALAGWDLVKNLYTHTIKPALTKIGEKVSDALEIRAFNENTLFSSNCFHYPVKSGELKPRCDYISGQLSTMAYPSWDDPKAGPWSIHQDIPTPVFNQAKAFGYRSPAALYAQAVKQLPYATAIRFPLKFGEIYVWRDKGTDLFERWDGVSESFSLVNWIPRAGLVCFNSPKITAQDSTASYYIETTANDPNGDSYQYENIIRFRPLSTAPHEVNIGCNLRYRSTTDGGSSPERIDQDYQAASDAWRRGDISPCSWTFKLRVGYSMPHAPISDDERQFMLQECEFKQNNLYLILGGSITDPNPFCIPFTDTAGLIRSMGVSWGADVEIKFQPIVGSLGTLSFFLNGSLLTAVTQSFNHYFIRRLIEENNGNGVYIGVTNQRVGDVYGSNGASLSGVIVGGAGGIINLPSISSPFALPCAIPPVEITLRSISLTFGDPGALKFQLDNKSDDYSNYPGWGVCVDNNDATSTGGRHAIPKIHYAIRLAPMYADSAISKLVDYQLGQYQDIDISKWINFQAPSNQGDQSGHDYMTYFAGDRVIYWNGNHFRDDNCEPNLNQQEGTASAIMTSSWIRLLGHSMSCMNYEDDRSLLQGLINSDAMMSTFMGALVRWGLIGNPTQGSQSWNFSSNFNSMTPAEQEAYKLAIYYSADRASFLKKTTLPPADSKILNKDICDKYLDIPYPSSENTYSTTFVINEAVNNLIFLHMYNKLGGQKLYDVSDSFNDHCFIPYDEVKSFPQGRFDLMSDNANRIKSAVQLGAMILGTALVIISATKATKLLLRKRVKTNKTILEGAASAKKMEAGKAYNDIQSIKSEARKAHRRLTSTEKSTISELKKAANLAAKQSLKAGKKASLVAMLGGLTTGAALSAGTKDKAATLREMRALLDSTNSDFQDAYDAEDLGEVDYGENIIAISQSVNAIPTTDYSEDITKIKSDLNSLRTSYNEFTESEAASDKADSERLDLIQEQSSNSSREMTDLLSSTSGDTLAAVTAVAGSLAAVIKSVDNIKVGSDSVSSDTV